MATGRLKLTTPVIEFADECTLILIAYDRTGRRRKFEIDMTAYDWACVGKHITQILRLLQNKASAIADAIR